MATCDVWKQTHKNSQNVFSSTAATSMLKPQEMSNMDEDVPSPVELANSSIFLNEDGNVMDSFDSSIDDIHQQFIMSWNMKTNSFDCKLSDYLYMNIFNDLLNQGQVTLSDAESDSDDTVFGVLSSDDDNDEDYNYFKNTYYNFDPILDQQYQQSMLEFQHQQQHRYVDLVEEQYEYQDQQVECNNYNEINDPCTITDYVNETSSWQQDQLVSKLVEPQQQQHMLINKLQIEIRDEIFIPSTVNNICVAPVLLTGSAPIASRNVCALVDTATSKNLHSAPIEQQQYHQPETIHNRREINGDPCTINVSKHNLHDEKNNMTGSVHVSVLGNEFRLNKTSQSDDDIGNSDEWSLMSFTFTKNNGECGSSGNLKSFFMVGNGSDTSSVSCDRNSSFSDTMSSSCSTNIDSSIISSSTSTDSSNIDPFFTPQLTYKNKNKIYHRKHKNKRKRKRNKYKKHNFFSVKDAINDLVYYSHKYGNQVGVTMTSLDGLSFLFVTNKNRIVKFRNKVQMHNLSNYEQISNFYPLRLLIDTLLELDIQYGNRIGINKLSYGKLKILFIGYSIDEIDEVVTNTKNIFY